MYKLGAYRSATYLNTRATRVSMRYAHHLSRLQFYTSITMHTSVSASSSSSFYDAIEKCH